MDEPDDGGGLLGGITDWMIRVLVDNPWNGGCGKSIQEVMAMSPDQIVFHLCDRGLLERESKGTKMDSMQAASELKPDKDGKYKGRDAKGNPIKAKFKGESLAARLTREAAEKKGK